MKYLKYRIPFNEIKTQIQTNNYKNITFFIDLNSISRGFYNRDVILFELNNYLELKRLPTLLIEELKIFLNNLHNSFNYLNPKFCIFYDLGRNLQNKAVYEKYKANRTNASKTYLIDDEERELYYQIKNYYFEKIQEQFNIRNLCKVVFFKDYESDFVPYAFIKKYKVNQDSSMMNVVLSVDKDLLQCCQFTNTFQAISVYLKSKSIIESTVYNDKNAISYIYKKADISNYPGITSKYIPLILAIAGDRQDGIEGVVKFLGVANLLKLIKLHNIPYDFNSTYSLPDILKPHYMKIQRNLALTSFERQIERMPSIEMEKV